MTGSTDTTSETLAWVAEVSALRAVAVREGGGSGVVAGADIVVLPPAEALRRLGELMSALTGAGPR